MSALPAEEVGEPSASHGAHRPQSLLLSFFGALVVDADLPPLPSVTLLDLLADLGVTEAAARATLKRMTQRGLLTRGQVGRTAEYALTPLAEDVLRRATERVTSPAPFEHPEGEWTLLSYSVPESRRDLRHRVRSRLTWAGFGGLRDGLWIAPGTVDVVAVLGRSDLADVAGLADAFAARPLPGTDVHRLVHRAWDVPAVRAAHTWFIDTWSRPPRVAGSLAQLTLLGADWLSLLRTDPGLPASQLGPAWPAAVSSTVYRRVFDGLAPAARAALERSLRTHGH
ncbi:Phenylacetic acid-responsive transcriptional repressor [Modestobacter italicus]|uniref:Phenylacetic acid-responsive transcriptional repressor n=1 Tax=Modestobacter italicus (strain DSM 44449 / CECT 9708 / BC 501) TaxID=2732864 RepID=I4ER17_MODI5|nr:PaaX family transcriptional regulator C-terminal domain-containing protein [Modestobacter marinus]CCH85830.1 Phenylacetic acid-responsive transcriptional repressor [Modestobacter marinus]